ncbi:MAG: agmatinase family protein [Solirubrobacterales bacterium]|nr:agmatinase family protein [Solirubrobacterales bacterium]MBV9916991.1 agmatinase family protein [Solirubrobacterales bacterium]
MTVLHAGIATFLGASCVSPERVALEEAQATVAVLGLPDDTTTVTRPGASHGPRAIREASSHFAFGGTYHFDYGVTISDHETVVDCGDVNPVAGNAARTFERAEAALAEIHSAGAFPVLLGGDHATLIPGARAAARAMSGRMGLVMLDTHLDTAPDIDGEELSHCSPVHRVLDLDNVDGTNVAIIGAHGAANPKLELDVAEAHGVHVFSVRDIDRLGIGSVARQALEAVSDGTDGVYLSFDIDVLDGAFAWGTCGPELGGMTGREVVQALEILTRANLIAMDCVEVAPFLDPSGNTARVGARVVLDVLAGRLAAGD